MSEAIEEEATCPICLDILRKPIRILTCGHNLCHLCLTELCGCSASRSRNHSNQRCPTCRQNIVLTSSGVDGFPRNRTLENIIAKVSVYNTSILPATATPDVPTASSGCPPPLPPKDCTLNEYADTISLRIQTAQTQDPVEVSMVQAQAEYEEPMRLQTAKEQSASHNELKNQKWYFGNLKRTDAEKMLMSRAKNGRYIIRDSETSAGQYSLSVRTPQKVRHFKIFLHEDEGEWEISGRRFKSMKILLETYKSHPVYTSSTHGDIFLMKPFKR
ncbi:unnamed protein product [Clavelina lepadiformis]|uniref:SH2 domain-containing protein n=1 Tax=Clavelina lepadiformis TaxID=159417 RepID=A0ABP0EY14_CLALP